MNQDANAWIKLGSTAVSDALRKCGKPFGAMDAGIRPLSQQMKLAGPAFTVRCYPGATWALEKAIELATPGDVLVVDGGGYPDVILMGELMSLRGKTRGLAGAIVDGAVRDVEGVIAGGFPVFSRHICPRGGTYAEIGEWQTLICCGRLPIRPGDWIVADASGVAVVPIEMLEQVKTEATNIDRWEHEMERFLRQGKALADAAAAAREASKGNPEK
jgi:4-hydroxy-4-methyl-2-oxoglutarate aldolase